MAGLRDELSAAADDQDQDRLRGELLRVRRDRDRANGENARLTALVDELRRTLDIVETAEGASIAPPKWLTPAKPAKGKRATLLLMLSDTHFDEVVRSEEVGNLNAYDRRIAELRLRSWAEKIGRAHV